MIRRIETRLLRQCGALWLLAAGAACLAATGFAHAEGTLEKVKRRGQVNVGYRADAAPFSYADAQKKPIGYSIEFCNAIAAQLGERLGLPNLRVNTLAIDADRVMRFVKEGTVDLYCSNASVTPARRELVSFSRPIYFDGVGVAVRKKDNIAHANQLADKQIVVIKDTTTGGAVEAWKQKVSASTRVETALNADAALSQLQLGWVQGYARDRVPLAMQVLNLDAGDQYAILPERLSTEVIAIAFRKDDAQMEALVNEVIASAAASGKARAWYDKWFVEPIPLERQRKALGIPMSPELKASLEAAK